MSNFLPLRRFVAALSVVAVALPLVPVAARAQASKKLDWGPAPAGLPAGARVAVLSGDPGKAGPFTIQLAMPNGYSVPPHSHPSSEHLTVKSGVFLLGMGDKVDRKAMKAYTRGQSADAPANMHHSAMAKGKTVVEIASTGPFVITYVNAADDPRTNGKR